MGNEFPFFVFQRLEDEKVAVLKVFVGLYFLFLVVGVHLLMFFLSEF